MWETTVLVQQKQVVSAAPEKVWELVGSPVALSALPSCFAFSVPAAVPGTDRLTCLFNAHTMSCHVLDVREEVPGQKICWQTRSTRTVGDMTLALSMIPQSRGCTIETTVKEVVPRVSKVESNDRRRRQVEAWITQLQAIAEGQAAWPRAGMPESMQEHCAVLPPVKSPADASAAAVINAPVDVVWQAVWAPETTLLTDPDVVFAGHVPGTPEGEAGEMQYTVVQRLPDGIVTASILVVREVSDGHRVLIRGINPPHDETVYLATAVPGGTRLELAFRWASRGKAHGKRNAAAEAKHLQAMANRYKTVIEESARPEATQL